MLAMLLAAAAAEDACLSKSLCTCELTDGNLIDLSPLGDEQFTVMDPNGAWTYEYRPCAPFKEGDNCTDVIMCQMEQMVGAMQNALGKPDSAKFLKVENKYMIRYEGDGERVSLVDLVCSSSENSTFTFDMEAPAGIYNFEFTSPYACEIAQNKSPSTSTSSTTTASTTKSSSTTKKSSTTAKSTKTTIKTITTTQGASAVSSSIFGVFCLALFTLMRAT
ncbi:hypothetical protein RRG08_051051 [Elysia crispata]|uniref:MRH domain-containing protein n=1 Tax=Elysia crispata TaxID=231223 RepID=A0AAE1DB22_9GAST|nr:hypothetical protein RRG08_051051 [Elysia crispata]